MTGVDAIRLAPADNVATVLRPVAAGDPIRVRCGADVTTLRALDPIPMCHKISVLPIEKGQAVIKYGHGIGTASARVEAGRHVHVHNLRSARARVPA